MMEFRSLVVGLCCVGLFTAVVIGAVILLISLSKRSRAQKASESSWPVTDGQVIAASVEESARMSPEEDQFYYPAVTFEFKVGKRQYQVRQAVGKPANWEGVAQRSLQKYPLGLTVRVRYNPTDPNEARLIR
jgi:hypothetical protein